MSTQYRHVRILPLLLLAALAPLAGCKDAIDEQFLDPERSTTAKVEYLFTQNLLDTDFPMDYWEGYYRIFRNVDRWDQATGTVNTDDMMDPNSAQWSDFWDRYYTRHLMVYKEMKAMYDAMPADQKKEYEAYVVLGKILKAYNTGVATDLWGDMPYSEAASARTAGKNLFPKYDTQEAIYDSLLADLKSAADRLKQADLVTPATLTTQDVFLKGDLMMWQRFANSLRLRFAMRLSEVAPQKAQAVVADVLNNGYPLIEDNSQNPLFPNMPNDNSWGDMGRAVRESVDETYASKVMMDLMNASNDPRIPVLFDPSYQGQYVGLPSSPDAQGTPSRENYAYVDSLLFDANYDFPAFVITAAEVSFLKAEAALRGWGPGSAKAWYDQGLRQSVEMWYQAYNANKQAPDVDMPSTAAVDQFVNSSSAAFDGTLKSIATQKWIHLNWSMPYEAWAEFRRLDYPAVGADMSGQRPLQRTVRITYPGSEITNNAANYEQVRAKDTNTTRVWWDVK